jgi:hypothetical protein
MPLNTLMQTPRRPSFDTRPLIHPPRPYQVRMRPPKLLEPDTDGLPPLPDPPSPLTCARQLVKLRRIYVRLGTFSHLASAFPTKARSWVGMLRDIGGSDILRTKSPKRPTYPTNARKSYSARTSPRKTYRKPYLQNPYDDLFVPCSPPSRPSTARASPRRTYHSSPTSESSYHSNAITSSTSSSLHQLSYRSNTSSRSSLHRDSHLTNASLLATASSFSLLNRPAHLPNKPLSAAVSPAISLERSPPDSRTKELVYSENIKNRALTTVPNSLPTTERRLSTHYTPYASMPPNTLYAVQVYCSGLVLLYFCFFSCSSNLCFFVNFELGY